MFRALADPMRRSLLDELASPTGKPLSMLQQRLPMTRFGDMKLVTVDDPVFGGWKKVQPTHFADGGIFDQIYKPTN